MTYLSFVTLLRIINQKIVDHASGFIIEHNNKHWLYTVFHGVGKTQDNWYLFVKYEQDRGLELIQVAGFNFLKIFDISKFDLKKRLNKAGNSIENVFMKEGNDIDIATLEIRSNINSLYQKFSPKARLLKNIQKLFIKLKSFTEFMMI